MYIQAVGDVASDPSDSYKVPRVLPTDKGKEMPIPVRKVMSWLEDTSQEVQIPVLAKQEIFLTKTRLI